MENTLQSENSNSITRQALGRVADIGLFYDARSDKFLHGQYAFPHALVYEKRKTFDRAHTEWKVIIEDKSTSRLNSLDVGTELKLSVMCGLVELEGSAKYLNETKKSTKTFRASMILKTTIRYETVSLVDLKDAFTGCENSTHVVTGVTYGGNVFFTFEQTLTTDTDVESISGALKAKMNLLFAKTEGSIGGDAKYKDEISEFVTNSSFSLRGDCVAPASDPRTSEQIQAMIEQIVTHVREHPVPISYTLISTGALKQFLAIPMIAPTCICYQVDEAILKQLEMMLTKLLGALLELSTLKYDMESFGANYFPPEIVAEVNDLDESIQPEIMRLRHSVLKTLHDFRSHQDDRAVAMVTLMTLWNESPASPVKISARVAQIERGVRGTISCFRDFVTPHDGYAPVTFVRNGDRIDHLLSAIGNRGKTIYFLRTSPDHSSSDDVDCIRYFNALRRDNLETRFYIIDSTIHQDDVIASRHFRDSIPVSCSSSSSIACSSSSSIACSSVNSASMVGSRSDSTKIYKYDGTGFIIEKISIPVVEGLISRFPVQILRKTDHQMDTILKDHAITPGNYLMVVHSLAGPASGLSHRVSSLFLSLAVRKMPTSTDRANKTDWYILFPTLAECLLAKFHVVSASTTRQIGWYAYSYMMPTFFNTSFIQIGSSTKIDVCVGITTEKGEHIRLEKNCLSVSFVLAQSI